MSHQKFDSKTTKKLLTNYQNTISKYASENEQLTRQLEDLKTTLTLNQNLLYDFIKSSVGEDESITALINESKQLWAENESLIKQKNDLEMKTAKLQELIEDTPTQIREEINLINAQNNKMKIELVQKDNTIKKLKNDLDKARKNALFKTARTEILVTEPTKTNVEINHELLNTKTILTKVSAMHAAEKIEKSIDLKNKEDIGKNLMGTQEEGLTDKEKLEIKNAKNIISEVTGNIDKPSVQMKKLLDEEQKVPPEDQFYPDLIVATNKKKLPPLKAKRIINIPMKEERWNLIDMFHADFKVVRIQKAKANPVLFNVYSNTKAAPFTAEKTQIPIAHRIGSFYSLSLQNFIIDKTNKSIKRLTDDYFFKYRNTKFEELATEDEEYLYIIKRGNINPEKIELKKDIFEYEE